MHIYIYAYVYIYIYTYIYIYIYTYIVHISAIVSEDRGGPGGRGGDRSSPGPQGQTRMHDKMHTCIHVFVCDAERLLQMLSDCSRKRTRSQGTAQ